MKSILLSVNLYFVVNVKSTIRLYTFYRGKQTNKLNFNSTGFGVLIVGNRLCVDFDWKVMNPINIFPMNFKLLLINK